jgi:hypothetical protein
MEGFLRRWIVIIAAAAGIFSLSFLSQVTAAASTAALQATATLRVTPQGPGILVPDQVNVRLGPGLDYDLVGVLISGQRAPALGRSPGGDWIQIEYPGVEGNVAWVYAPLVNLDPPGFLQVVELPPTPTPRVTATIDPTLAAQFNLLDVTPTRLPTYTPAGPIVQPTISTESDPVSGRGFPPILAILGLLVVGLFGTVISVLRGS